MVSRRAGWLPAVGLLLATACAEEPIPLESFTIMVQLKSEVPGVDLSGIPVSFGSQQKGRLLTDKVGRRGVSYRGAVGSQLRVRVELPAHLTTTQATDRQFPLELGPDKKPKPVRFLLMVRPADAAAPDPAPAAPAARRFVLAADTGCPHQDIHLDGASVGETDSSGYTEIEFSRAAGASIEVYAPANKRCEALRCKLTLGSRVIVGFDARCATPSAESTPAAPAPVPEAAVAAATVEAPKPRTQPAAADHRGTDAATRRAPPKSSKTPPRGRAERAAPARSHAARTRRVVSKSRSKVPPPAPTPPPPAGARVVPVSCEPAGLSLLVDGKPALARCDGGAVVPLRPGVHKLQLRGPDCPLSRPVFTEIPAKGALPTVKVQTGCERSCQERVKAALAAKQRLSEAQLTCLKVSPQEDGYLSAQLLLSHAYLTSGYTAKAEQVLDRAAKHPRARTQPELQLRLGSLKLRAKKYDEALTHADLAHRYRTNFKSGRRRWFVKVAELRAGVLEQLYYRDQGDKSYRKAVSAYESLLALTKKTKNRKKIGKVEAALRRMKQQARRSHGG